MVRGAVEAEVDTKGHRGPRRVLCTAVEASLAIPEPSAIDILRHGAHHISWGTASGSRPTLFAGLVFSFSKIFSDCCLEARPLILSLRLALSLE